MAGTACAPATGRVEGWVEAHGAELRRHLGRLTGDPDEADDLLQQVWLAAVRKPPPDGPDANPRAWLYRVATNAALDRLARQRVHARAVAAADGHALAADPPAPDAEALALATVDRTRIRAACARLPAKQREAVWLRWAEGFEYSTIAERLGCSLESARANVYQGMRKLRADLADLWKELEG